jgi:NarL family two-component system response regulator YdfI
MRVILVGSPRDRARLRSQLDGTSIEIVGEVASAADVRPGADAMVMAGPPAELPRGADVAGDDAPLAEPLTARETQVLGLMAEGLPNKAIAGALGISDQTVKFHVASIAGKLGAANRTDAVRRAVRRGLIAL